MLSGKKQEFGAALYRRDTVIYAVDKIQDAQVRRKEQTWITIV